MEDVSMTHKTDQADGVADSQGIKTQSAGSEGATILIDQIQRLIPHRYPILLIDKIIKAVPNESAIGIKNVTCNEWFFVGHFPSRPVMPGVLIIEALAQTAGALVMFSSGFESKNKLVYFMSIEEARFRRPVVPGDVLQLRVKKQRHRANVWRFEGNAFVDDLLVAEATFTAMIADE